MSESLITYVFKIVGILLLSYLLFYLIFSTTGQNILWYGAKTAVEKTWDDSTMSNGAERTLIYEDFFEEVKNETDSKYIVN